MATPYLPSVDATINALGALGEDTSLRARSKRFTDLGLDKRLGAFVGTPSQNQALLKTVQGEQAAAGKLPASTALQFTSLPQQQAPSLSNFFTGLTGAFSPLLSGLKSTAPVTQPGAIQTKLPQTGLPAPEPLPAISPFVQEQTPKPTAAEATTALGVTKAEAQAPTKEAVETLGQTRTVTLPTGAQVEIDAKGNILREVKAAPVPVADAAGEKIVKDETGALKTASEAKDESTKSSLGFSASDIIPKSPDEMELFNDFLNSSDFANLKARYDLQGLSADAQAQQAKDELEARYESERAQLEDQLGKRGLFMSGIRSTQVKALADRLAVQELGVDRTLASKLLDINLDLREGILKGVAEIVKKAQDGRKDAIEQLNKVGLAVVGNKLVPTVESIRETRLQETADITTVLNQAKLELSQAKTATQLEIAQQRLQLAIDKAGGQNRAYDNAQSIIDANPDASFEQLRSALLRLEGLSVTDVDALLTSQGIVKETPLSEDNLQAIAKGFLKANASIFAGAETEKTRAVEYIRDVGVAIINGKNVTLSKRQREAILKIIEEKYPKGRSLVAKTLPGGK